MPSNTRVLMGAIIAAVVAPSLAAAQAPPAPTPDAVVPAPPPAPPPPKEIDYWKANAQAGVLWLSGNSNSLAISAGGVLARDDKLNVLTLTARGSYMSSANPPADDSPLAKAAAANWLAAIRYDRLLGDPNPEGLRLTNLFVEARVSQDKFAGIWLRPEATVGAGRYFVRSIVQTFRGELGFNYQHEWSAVDPAPTAMPATNPIDFDAGREKNYYGARLGLLYENKITPYASFSEIVELIVSGTTDTPLPTDAALRALFTNVASLSSNITTRVTIKLQDTLKVNSQPAAGVSKQWDNTLEVALAVTLL